MDFVFDVRDLLFLLAQLTGKFPSGFLQILESSEPIKPQCENHMDVAASCSRAPSQLTSPSLPLVSQLPSHPGQVSGEMASSIMYGVFLINTVQYHFLQEILQLTFLGEVSSSI